jgi:hypothetical protein
VNKSVEKTYRGHKIAVVTKTERVDTFGGTSFPVSMTLVLDGVEAFKRGVYATSIRPKRRQMFRDGRKIIRSMQ